MTGDPLVMSCPYCGESADLVIDEGGGCRQTYVEDCPVCCHPWQVEVMRDPEIGWMAMLRQLDE